MSRAREVSQYGWKDGMLSAKADFGCLGDSSTDDTVALQAAKEQT